MSESDGSRPTNIVRRDEDPGVRRAYQLIEELMVAANEAVGEWLEEHGREVIYRVHPPPSERRLATLVSLCESLGVPIAAYEDAGDPRKLGEFLRRVRGHGLEEVVGMLALRSLARASYDTTAVGHYGLAMSSYVHFTSPIRRYPDLAIHRQVKNVLRHEKGARVSEEALRDVAVHCSERERVVADVEREVVDIYRCVVMRGRVGTMCEGTVMEVGTGSVTVALDDPFVEVLVPAGLLGGGPYERSDDGLHLVCVRSGSRVSLGDRMTVEVEASNVVDRVVLGRRLDVEVGGGYERNRRRGNQGRRAVYRQT